MKTETTTTASAAGEASEAEEEEAAAIKALPAHERLHKKGELMRVRFFPFVPYHVILCCVLIMKGSCVLWVRVSFWLCHGCGCGGPLTSIPSNDNPMTETQGGAAAAAALRLHLRTPARGTLLSLLLLLYIHIYIHP